MEENGELELSPEPAGFLDGVIISQDKRVTYSGRDTIYQQNWNRKRRGMSRASSSRSLAN